MLIFARAGRFHHRHKCHIYSRFAIPSVFFTAGTALAPFGKTTLPGLRTRALSKGRSGYLVEYTTTCIKGQDVLILGLPQDVAFFPVAALASSSMLVEEDAVAVLRYNQHIY